MKKISIYLCFFMFLVLLCNNAIGKCPDANADIDSRLKSLNLDFEKPTPAGWKFLGEGYRVELDQNEAAGGKQSLCFTFVNDVIDLREPPFGLAVATLPGASLAGKRIRFSASLKTRDSNVYVTHYLRAVAGEDPVAAAAIPGDKIPGTTKDWERYHIEMYIPPETTSLCFGAGVSGKGTAWVDELSIEILPSLESPSVAIGGKVADKDGNPVPGALVTAKTFYSETTPFITTSDMDGKFAFKLLPGPYMLSATAPVLTAGSLPMRFFEKEVHDLVIPLNGEGFTIKGKVNFLAGKMSTDTYLVINKLDFFGGDMFYVRPQPDGSFQINVPVGVSYNVHLDSPGLQAMPVVIKSGAKQECILEAFIPQPAPDEVISWMKQHAVTLRTPEPGHGFTDLQPLKKIIGDARVVGLGENSHGTREIFQMKHRFLEFLVEEMDFTVFAIEALWPQSLAVNQYVLHGKGDPSRVLAGLYFVWDTREVLALIQWMREYNTDPAHKKKLKFYGVDIQGSSVGADLVSRYLEKVDPDFARQEQMGKALSVLKNPRVYQVISTFPEQACISLKQSINELLLRFDRQKEVYAKTSSQEEWLETRQLVRYLQQFVYHATAGNTSDYDAINLRDRAIADNIRWILDHEPAGTRIVYWAHNYHVGLAQYPTYSSIPSGMYLQQMLGRDYLSIAFEFNQGCFHSRDSTESQTAFLMKRFTVGSNPGSFATAMSRTGIPIFLLDLRNIPGEGVVYDWFSRPHEFKSIDSVFANEKDIMHLFKLPAYFDAVIFLDKTTSTQPNPSSPIPRLLY